MTHGSPLSKDGISHGFFAVGSGLRRAIEA